MKRLLDAMVRLLRPKQTPALAVNRRWIARWRNYEGVGDSKHEAVQACLRKAKADGAWRGEL